MKIYTPYIGILPAMKEVEVTYRDAVDTDPMDSATVDRVIARLDATLPAIFARREVPRLLGGAIAAGTLANLGKSGPMYFFVNRNAVYEKTSFLSWLRTQIRIPRD